MTEQVRAGTFGKKRSEEFRRQIEEVRQRQQQRSPFKSKTKRDSLASMTLDGKQKRKPSHGSNLAHLNIDMVNSMHKTQADGNDHKMSSFLKLPGLTIKGQGDGSDS